MDFSGLSASLRATCVCVCVCVSKTSRAGSSVNQGQRIKIIMIIIKRSQIFTGFSARVARFVLLLVKKHQTVRAVHHLHSYIAMQSISDRETQHFYLILCFSAVGANSINFRVTHNAQKWGRKRERSWKNRMEDEDKWGNTSWTNISIRWQFAALSETTVFFHRLCSCSILLNFKAKTYKTYIVSFHIPSNLYPIKHVFFYFPVWYHLQPFV